MRRTPLRQVPTDPTGTPIELDPATGRASVSKTSPLQPMPNLDRASLMTVDVIGLVAIGVLGLAVGSFFNVCIHRLPRHGSIVRPASSCPHCGYVLRWFDNVPVLSYMLLRGRCRKCKAAISIRYPIVEIVTAGIFVAHYQVFGPDIILVPRLVFASAMIVLFAIDLEHHLLPNVITLPGIVVGLLFATMLPPGLVDALIGVVAGGGVLWLVGEAYYRYSGQEGMGGGDVKMLAMIGAFLGWQLMILTLVLSSVLGSVIGLLVIAFKRGGMKYALPVRDIFVDRGARRVTRRPSDHRLVRRVLSIKPPVSALTYNSVDRLFRFGTSRRTPRRQDCVRHHLTPLKTIS